MIAAPARVDLSRNPKQYDYFLEVVKACNGVTKKRKFAYGGAIRGGKTWITLFILTWLCKMYPNSKWYVIREDFPVLQSTTIESLKKMLRGSPDWNWHSEKGNYYVERRNGSRIYFIGENYIRDKDLNDFLGLECNGVFLEQLEGLQEKLWEITSSRVGSWYIDPMPPALMFTTFNPTQKWPKTKIYEAYQKGTLADDFFYMSALPSDNAFVTEDQWNTWGQMAERYQKQFIEGDWTDFDDTDPRWLFCLNEQKTFQPCEYISNMTANGSMDFNINPLCAIIGQHTTSYGPGCFVHILKEFALKDSVVYELCDHLLTEYPYAVWTLTGDATGRNRNAGYTSGQANIWDMVKTRMKLSNAQMLTPTSNPSMSNSRFLCNDLLQRHPNYKIHPQCEKLKWEMKNAKPKPTNSPDYEDVLLKGPGSSDIGMNLLDCWRYYNHTHLNTFSKNPF